MERTSFLGFNLAPEVKKALPLLVKVDQKVFRELLELEVNYLKGDDPTDEQMGSLSVSSKIPLKNLAILFTGVFYILRAAIRQKTDIKDVRNDLLELKIPQNIITDLETVLRRSQSAFEQSVRESRIRFPSLVSLKWRTDVTISTSSMARVMAPTVLMEMTASDGVINTFEVAHDKFHQLRHDVARVLKDMEELEQTHILKMDR